MEEDTNKTIDDIIDGNGSVEESKEEVTPENDKQETQQEEEVNPEKDEEQKEESSQQEESSEKDKEESDKDQESSVIKKLRSNVRNTNKQVKQYEKMLDKVAKQKGISKDELVENLQREADEKEAKEKNISPEIQKQLREQQEALENLKQERQREVFNSKFEKLSEKHPMDNDQARDFVNQAIEKGIDLGNPNTDFEAVYVALNYNDIIENVRKETEQEVLKRIEEQEKKAPRTSKKRSQSEGLRKGNVDNILNDLNIK